MITLTIQIFTDGGVVKCISDCPSVVCTEQEDELFKEIATSITNVLQSRASRLGAKMFVYEGENTIKPNTSN